MLTLTLPTMTCGGCVAAVRQALAPLPGLGQVEIDLATKQVRVEGAPDGDKVRAAIREAGFEIAA
jgi:copper chaperone